jgi:hypothetical protein
MRYSCSRLTIVYWEARVTVTQLSVYIYGGIWLRNTMVYLESACHKKTFSTLHVTQHDTSEGFQLYVVQSLQVHVRVCNNSCPKLCVTCVYMMDTQRNFSAI